MAEISKITLPSGSTYDLKDATARELISQLEGYTAYIGVTTTALTDGATTNPITINGASVTAVNGNIANYGSKEFIFNGTNWNEFGDLSGLGDLAFKDSASGSYTPAGTVSQPTFTGNKLTSTGSYTPAGTIGLTNTNKTATVSKASSGDATYTPQGTVSQPTFSGSSTTVTVTATANTNGNYQPAGSNSGGGVTLNTTTVNSITDVGSMPTYTVSSETLTITAGSTPTKGANTTVATSVKTFTQPTFTGTKVQLAGSCTPAGTVSQPTFTGTGARLVTGNIAVPTSASFTGTEADISVEGTPSGTVSKPTFSGTAKTVTVS